MNKKTFLITLALVLALASVALFSWGKHLGIPPAADDDYYYARKAVTAKCGQNVQLLGILMRKGNTTYAFTHGTCGSGSANDYVEVGYDLASHMVGNPMVHDLTKLGVFQNSQPISLTDWKLNSREAFRIVSEQHGFEGFTDFLPNQVVGQQAISGALGLHQAGPVLQWLYSYSNGPYGYAFYINAATGQVMSSSTHVTGTP